MNDISTHQNSNKQPTYLYHFQHIKIDMHYFKAGIKNNLLSISQFEITFKCILAMGGGLSQFCSIFFDILIQFQLKNSLGYILIKEGSKFVTLYQIYKQIIYARVKVQFMVIEIFSFAGTSFAGCSRYIGVSLPCTVLVFCLEVANPTRLFSKSNSV